LTLNGIKAKQADEKSKLSFVQTTVPLNHIKMYEQFRSAPLPNSKYLEMSLKEQSAGEKK